MLYSSLPHPYVASLSPFVSLLLPPGKFPSLGRNRSGDLYVNFWGPLNWTREVRLSIDALY